MGVFTMARWIIERYTSLMIQTEPEVRREAHMGMHVDFKWKIRYCVRPWTHDPTWTFGRG